MKRQRLSILVLAALALLALPFLVQTQYYVHIMILAGLYVVLALSYDLSVGHVGDLSLGHSAFIGLGAYTAGVLSTKLGAPFVANILVAILLSVVLAAVIGYPSFRLSAHAFAMATMGFSIVAYTLAQNWTRLTGGPMCISQIPRPVVSLGGLSWTIDSLKDFYFVVLALATVTVGIVLLLVRSRVGRAFIAVREDPVLAAARGINPEKYRLLAFCTGAGLASVAGVVYAQYMTVVCPTDFSMNVTVNLLIMVFIGGAGTLGGVIAGAVVFTILPEILRIEPTWRLVIYGLILIVMIVNLPEGLRGLPAALQRLRPPVSATPDQEGG